VEAIRLADGLTRQAGSGIEAPLQFRAIPRLFYPGDIMAEDIIESTQTVAAGQLRAFIERIERLEEDKQAIADDIKDVFAEMKGTGFDVKAVRQIIRLRKKDQAERQEEEAILDLYLNALGMA
jgi:uncharacterized protein (UPF0335 family)